MSRTRTEGLTGFGFVKLLKGPIGSPLGESWRESLVPIMNDMEDYITLLGFVGVIATILASAATHEYDTGR